MGASINGKVKDVLAAAEAQGCLVTQRSNGHYLIQDAAGTFMGMLPHSGGSPTSLQNNISELKRNGLVWPCDVKKLRKARRAAEAAAAAQ